jgi:hypothetical protein
MSSAETSSTLGRCLGENARFSRAKGIRDSPTAGLGSAAKRGCFGAGIPPQRSENPARSHKLSLAYEMQVEDLDGNVLRLGSDSKENEHAGEWLDMQGKRWVPIPEGGWKPAE